MRKKVLISLVPLVVTAAFAASPAASLAASHYFKNNVLIKEGTQVPVISWGTLTLSNEATGSVTCQNAASGYVENPAGGGAGKGLTQTFTPYNCVSAGCPAVMEVKSHKDQNDIGAAAGEGWPSTLTEAPIRAVTTGVEVEVKCWLPPAEVFLDVEYTGSNQPLNKNGTSSGKPSFEEFDAASGTLESVVGPGKTEKTIKIEGYNEQEVITSN